MGSENLEGGSAGPIVRSQFLVRDFESSASQQGRRFIAAFPSPAVTAPASKSTGEPSATLPYQELKIDQCAELPNIDHLIDDLVVQHDGPSQKIPDGNSPIAGGNGADDIDGLIERGAPKSQRSEAFARVVWSLGGRGCHSKR